MGYCRRGLLPSWLLSSCVYGNVTATSGARAVFEGFLLIGPLALADGAARRHGTTARRLRDAVTRERSQDPKAPRLSRAGGEGTRASARTARDQPSHLKRTTPLEFESWRSPTDE